ncbi:hypothetical protein B0H13DRAFT_2331327 [Mycena leptocephala]|nr:hypothetical protein B0H13DRAFT_2331327 [Mycena leptocephala]
MCPEISKCVRDLKRGKIASNLGEAQDEQSMQSWIGEIRSQAFTIEEAIGTTVSDQDKILALTMGLPAAYDPVIINFDSASPDTLTFNGVVAWLLNEETRQHSAITGTNPEIKGEREASFIAAAGRGSRADVICHFCDKKGHYKSECREKMKWEELREKKKEESNMAAADFDASCLSLHGLDSVVLQDIFKVPISMDEDTDPIKRNRFDDAADATTGGPARC